MKYNRAMGVRLALLAHYYFNGLLSDNEFLEGVKRLQAVERFGYKTRV